MANWRACGHAAVVGVVLAALLAGCSADPSTVPTPAPATASATPTAAATPTESSMERKQREDFEAAEKAYRTFMAENNRLQRAGGASQPTKKLKSVAGGPYLAFYAKFLAFQKREGIRYSDDIYIVSLRYGDYSQGEVTLEVCEDATSMKAFDARGKQIDQGLALLRSIYVRERNGSWKVWNGDERGEVARCEA